MRKDQNFIKKFSNFTNENIESNINKSEEFLKELSELLIKYNAEIYVDLEGDTHGVKSSIVIDVDRKEVGRYDDNLDDLIY